jgi:ribosomal protein L6P/L9E
MSRVAKAPVTIPAGVEVTLNGQELSIKRCARVLVVPSTPV